MRRVERGIDQGAPGPRHPSWLARVRAKTRESKGAAALEAAIVTPVFFILVMGIFEIGMAMNDYLALSSAVRAGSRTASASGNDLYADYNTVQRILREATALDEGDIDYIVIYKPNGFGEAPSASCQAGTPSSAPTSPCNVYHSLNWTMAQEDWGCTEPDSPDRHWCPTGRKVSLSGAGSDYVGVWMRVNHRWVTRMFGNAVTLTDQSVIRLEPRVVNDTD